VYWSVIPARASGENPPDLNRAREVDLRMLWWFIGVWLASGAVLPAFWLLGMGYRWLASSTIDPKWPYVLSGLVGIGVSALIMLFVCPFSDSIIQTRDMPSASAVAQETMTHVAEASPIQLLVTLPPSPAQFSAKPTQGDTDIEEEEVLRGLPGEHPSLGEAEQVAPIQPGIGDIGQSAGDSAIHPTDAVAPQGAVLAPLLTVVLHPKLDAKPSMPHRHVIGPPVRPYVTRSSSRGIWLFAPNNGNEGARN